MRWFDKTRLRLRSLFSRQQVERELDAELRFHLEQQIEENVANGMSPEEARLVAIGGMQQAKEQCRDTRRLNLIDDFSRDLRYAARTFARSPGFTAVVVLSLALGIGANTAIFSLIDAVMLRMLPVHDPGRLVLLELFNEGSGRAGFSYPLYQSIRDHNKIFSGIVASTWASNDPNDMVGPGPGSRPEKVQVQLVSGDYFPVLGVATFIGRALTPTDNETPGAHPVAVISHAFWVRRFAQDSSIVGKNIALNKQPFTVVGVTPTEFFGTEVGQAPEVWVPLMMQPSLDRGASILDSPNHGWLQVMARLRPDTTETQARAVMSMLVDDGTRSKPADGKPNRIRVEVHNGGKGFSELRTRFSVPLGILMAIVGLLLLIACSNVANLLLARGSARQREIGVRLAIGAGRSRLIRQFLTESALLSFLGGALGLLLAWWSSRALLLLVSGGSKPIPLDLTPNFRVLGFAIATSIVTTILFGLAPALQSTRQELNTALKSSSSAVRNSLLRPAVVAQVALSLLLLTGAGLFIRTLRNLQYVDLGFAAQHVIQARMSNGYSRDQQSGLHTRLLTKLRSTPGVLSASMGPGFRSGDSRTCCIAVEGYTEYSEPNRRIRNEAVAPGYFQTMGIKLLLGRDFDARDTEPPRRTAIINETAARYYYGSSNPVGHRFGWGDPPKVKYAFEIVGVVKDPIYDGPREGAPRMIFFPTQIGAMFETRVAGDPVVMVSTIRRAIQEVDSDIRIHSIDAIPQILERSLAQERLVAKLSTCFGLLALLLAGVGLYGVMAYAVARRTQEIGIRMALGARPKHVRWLVLRETLILVVIGAGVGAPAALAGARLISKQLYGVSPADPLTLTAATVLLVGAATLAGYVPARRASHIDPMVALKFE